MRVSSQSGSIFPVLPPQPYKNCSGGSVNSKASQNKCDQVCLSREPVGERRFQMDLVSRLSQEVRTATTTGEIKQLTKQVAQGAYHPDPIETAAKMLLMKGDDSQ